MEYIPSRRKRGRKKRTSPFKVTDHPASDFITMSALSKFLINSVNLRKTNYIPERFKSDVKRLLDFIEDWKQEVKYKNSIK